MQCGTVLKILYAHWNLKIWLCNLDDQCVAQAILYVVRQAIMQDAYATETKLVR